MKIIFFKSQHEDGDKAEKLLKKAKIDFITILACNDINVPTLIVPSIVGAFEGLKEIKDYIDLYR
jgi:hypothetical protein